MNGRYRGAFRCTDIDSISGHPAGTTGRAKRSRDTARCRPVQRATKRCQRDSDRFGGVARRQIRELLLQPLRCDAQLSGELGVQVPSLIDFRNERLACRDRPLRGGPRAVRFDGGLLELAGPPLHRVALLLQLGERLSMLGNPLLVDARQSRDGPNRARELPHASHVEQHPCVSTAAALVDVNEANLEIG
jgi:hypothetical protein